MPNPLTLPTLSNSVKFSMLAYRYYLSALVVALIPLGCASADDLSDREVLPTVADTSATNNAAQSSAPPQKPAGKPLYLKADRMRHDEVLDTTFAEGHVHIYHPDGYVLMADKVTYSPSTHQMTADGNVTLYDTNQEIIFADAFKGSSTFRDGTMTRPRSLTSDNRRTASVVGYKDGAIARMEKSVYTACTSCSVEGPKTPLWQIRSREVVHDEEAHEIIYKDAWMELWGVPVFYLPQMTQPDPTVDRLSGFLGTKITSTTALGLRFAPVYYHVFSPQSDLQLNPVIGGKVNPLLAATFRQRFRRAALYMEGSYTHAPIAPQKKNTHRWYNLSRLDYDINDIWRLKATFYRQSDPNYLLQYKLIESLHASPDNLQSEVVAEGFYGQNYAKIESYAFQTAKQGIDQQTMPLVLPSMSYTMVGQPDADNGSHFFGSAGLLNIHRQTGASVQRLSTQGGWSIPFMTQYGDLLTFTTKASLDSYATEHFQAAGTTTAKSYLQARVFPQVGLEWRRPFINESLAIPMVISPIASIIGAPNMGQNNKIPNEDSLGGIELDDSNLFLMDRFAGKDRLDSGSRINYGFLTEFYPQHWRTAKFFLGQSYAFTQNKAIGPNTGVGKGISDVVGLMELAPGDYLTTRYRFLYDTHHKRIRVSQASITAGVPIFKVGATYLSNAPDAIASGFQGGKQLGITLSSEFIKFWTANYGITQNLGTQRGTLGQNIGITYQDECFKFGTQISRTYFNTAAVKKDTAIVVTFGFRTLGEYSSGTAISSILGTKPITSP